MADGAIVALPLPLIGLDPRPERQIRPLDQRHVTALVETTNPDEWDAIEVRPWPATDPYPPGEAPPLYQVISGYHRTTAARQLGRTTIRAVVVTEPLDDLGFQLRAYRTNARHGLPMSTDEKRALAQRLRGLGMSELMIAREMGTPRGTVHNWLSGRDTNAARQQVVHTHKAGGDSSVPAGDLLPAAWRVVLPLDARQAVKVASTIADFLATTPAHLTPGEVVAWAATQPPLTRRSLALDVTQTIEWLGYLRVALAHDDSESQEGVA